MAAGKVVKFDQARGFGFIAPDGGGEDVFLHVNDLRMSESEVRPGVLVEFDVDEGGRGLKASNIRLVEGQGSAAAQPVRGPGPLPSGSLAGPARPAVAFMDATAARPADQHDDGEMCDVLSQQEFSAQITEVLLAVSTLTGSQILEIRRHLLEFSKRHGWIG